MPTPIELVAALNIGTVESVAPDEIRVLLDLDAPQATALNAGSPSAFPRINGYVLIPSEVGAVVGIIRWLGVEKSAFPRRTGLKDFGIIDLPYPIRKMTVAPLGTLSIGRTASELTLRRGVGVFPSVGDQVLMPTADQVKAIVEAQGKDRRVIIGVSPLATGVSVSVDPDKLFGRHLAVLGNTGSGKSCTVAGLIRWSLEAGALARQRAGRSNAVNARFIVLDPNGEYGEAFDDLPGATRVFRVPPVDPPILPLVVPAWIWNGHEWASFANAAPGTQRPLLMQAIRNLRAGAALEEVAEVQAVRMLIGYRGMLKDRIAAGPAALADWKQAQDIGRFIEGVGKDAAYHARTVSGDASEALEDLATTAGRIRNEHFRKDKQYYNAFAEVDLREVVERIEAALTRLPDESAPARASEDSPIAFDVTQVPSHLEQVAALTGGGQATQFISTLTLRIRTMLSDRRLAPVVSGHEELAFEEWLTTTIGGEDAANGQVAVLDLSLVPSDVIHIVVAVLGRVIFEALQRYRKLNNSVLPTALVLEEAHTFIQRHLRDEDALATPALMCRRTFERIAREGRKFGLGLVLSSQRPAELSETVLAQCNTFLLHRLVNDRDQDLVRRLVPDQVAGLLSELPSLPTRRAVMLGWAAQFPTMVDIRELAVEHRPTSSDADFWNVWLGTRAAPVEWSEVAKDWMP